MNILCTICARGGSKGVKNKNIRPFLEKPLIAQTLQQALASSIFSAVSVSSDSAEILAVAQNYGAHFQIQRPPELATDTAAKIPAIRHALEDTEKQSGQRYDILVDLDCSSPLRSVQDIVTCVNLLKERKASNVITAMPARRSPYFNMVEVSEDGIPFLVKKLDTPVGRRQDAPAVYDMNASIYVWQREVLLRENTLFLPTTALYVMPEERSWDIDSETDFEFVEFLARKAQGL